ncbi:hypothetical protein [Pandoraea morbifera]|uniref:hypothetical protein n=1 Tax=Pandoraea morbifera TaxID=2508300 RepID=UPI001FEC7DB4|nr:hypothetical protein [Pandoraea morbifera]
MAEQPAATASAPTAAFRALHAGVVAASEATVPVTLTPAAPSMPPAAAFVAKIHFVQVQRAPAHEIAT